MAARYCNNYNYEVYPPLAVALGRKLGQFGGEVELFGGEASPAPPSLDETLLAADDEVM